MNPNLEDKVIWAPSDTKTFTVKNLVKYSSQINVVGIKTILIKLIYSYGFYINIRSLQLTICKEEVGPLSIDATCTKGGGKRGTLSSQMQSHMGSMGLFPEQSEFFVD